MNEQVSPNLAPSKVRTSQHYLALDGLRGVAALSVLIGHFTARTDMPWLFGHSYLAVDFFFALSGFVLTHAYGEKLREKRLSTFQFVIQRLVRLLPLVILGTLLAALIETQRPDIANFKQHWSDTISAFILGSLLLPMFWDTTLEKAVIFPLNGPVWSLFFELFINLVAAPFPHFKRFAWIVPAVVFVSGLALASAALRIGTANVGYSSGTFWVGFPRVAFSFFLGAILYTIRHKALPMPFIVSLIILLAVLATPSNRSYENALFDIVCIFFIFPMIILSSSGANLRRTGNYLCGWSGDLSYPIYALHYPLMRAAGTVLHKIQLGLIGQFAFVLVSSALIVVFSAVAYWLYDIPIRKYLHRLVSKTNRQASEREA